MKKRCEWCGKEFEPNKYRPKQKFCCEKCQMKKWREEHLEYDKKYRKEHPKKVKVINKKYYEKNKDNPEFKEKRKVINKKYRKEHKEEIKANYKQWQKKILKENPTFKLERNLRCRIKKALRLYTQTGKIMSSRKYGINYKKIIEHLKPFPKDIENYEVDHIIPLSWFDFNNPKEIKWAFAPENHQWLLKEENMSKGNRFMG